MSNHTPEPWKALPHESVVFIMAGEYANGTAAASAATPCVGCCDRYCHGPLHEVQANADRIVACVNAMAGIPDPAAEMARLRAVEAALTRIASMPTGPFSPEVTTSFLHEAISLARAAKVGGGA